MVLSCLWILEIGINLDILLGFIREFYLSSFWAQFEVSGYLTMGLRLAIMHGIALLVDLVSICYRTWIR